MAEYLEREALLHEMKMDIRPPFAVVRDFPPADVAPVVHGNWVSCFEDWRKKIEGDKCSSCGFEHYGTNIRSYNFCPNCGAKMDLEDEKNDRP